MGSHQVSLWAQASLRVGILKGQEVAEVFVDLSKSLHPLLVTRYSADNFCKNPTLPFIFSGALSKIAAFLM